MTEVRFPPLKDFSFRHNVQTGSEAHPISYTTDIELLVSGIKLSTYLYVLPKLKCLELSLQSTTSAWREA
jgi:hypothetical protein